ncbi:MAG: hypothetical protein ACPGYF_04865 [Chitinophagales bacterium]
MISRVSLIVLGLFALTAYGQSRKSYSGPYWADQNSTTRGLDGNTTYTYYEDENGNRLYDGAFSYTGTKSAGNDKFTVSIKGTYEDHLRSGSFNTTTTLRSSGSSGTISCKTNYAKGYANGLWTINATVTGESISVNFSNNIGNGSFSYKTQDLSIRGQMNNKGLLDGDIVIIEGKWQTTTTYDNGLQINYITKNTQTGQITKREETSKEQVAFFHQILAAMEEGDTSALENIPYTLDKTYDLLIKDKYVSMFSDYNFPKAAPGDLSTDKYYTSYAWDAFGVIELVEQETRDQRIAREKREEEERLAREADLKRQEEERLAREAAARAEEERLAEEGRMRNAIYEADNLFKQYPGLDAKIEVELTDFTGIYFFTSKFLLAPYRVLRDSYVNDYNSMVGDFERAYELQSTAAKLVTLCNKVLDLMKLSKAENKELKLSLKGETDVETLERLFEIQ